MKTWLVILVASLIGAAIATWMVYHQHADSIQAIALAGITGTFGGVTIILAIDRAFAGGRVRGDASHL